MGYSKFKKIISWLFTHITTKCFTIGVIIFIPLQEGIIFLTSLLVLNNLNLLIF